jgi:prepilin-type N-terminal cleavage/methylation domain-containing protein
MPLVSRRILAAARRRAAHERGYTLIELLLATSAGLVVAGAAMALLISAQTISINDGDRVDSDQAGGAAMEQIMQALESSCVQGVDVSPIVGAVGGTGLTGSVSAAASSNNSLTFYSSLTDAPSVSNPNENVIYLGSTGGPLYMATYQYSSTAHGYPSAPTSTTQLLAHAAPYGSTTTTGSTTPIFTYDGYDASSGTLSDQYSGSPSLGATNAANTAEVGVEFEAEPSDGNNPANAGANLSDAAVLRLTAVPDASIGTTGSTEVSPCA